MTSQCFTKIQNVFPEINTVEGLIDAVKEGLEQDQPVRRALDSDTADKIDQFIEELTKLKDVETPFEMACIV